jgi:hypothetical protein
MTPLSPIAHPAGNESPTIGLRDWIAGVRPVAGTVAASGLLLLACGWFALEAGGLGRHRDVGQPSPVRLQTNPAATTAQASHTPGRALHARGDVGRAGTAPRAHRVGGARQDAGAPAPARQESTPAPPQPTRASSAPAAQNTSPAPATTTTNLPPPLDEVPTTVTVPPTPVTPGVTVPLPQAPSVPAPAPVVTTVTNTLGLP